MTETVHSSTVNGVTVTSAMTPEERYNAIAKSMGAPTVERPVGRFGPEGHPHVMVPDEATARAMTGTVGNKAPPPTPQQLELANSGNVEQFDREMRAAGMQIKRDGQRVSTTEVDQNALGKLEKEYRRAIKQYQDNLADSTLKPGARAEVQRLIDETRADFERDLRALMEGGKSSAVATGPLSQPVKGQHYRELTVAGKTMQDGLLAELRALPKAEQSDPATIDKYAAALVSIRANEHGNVSVEHFNPDSLHGYTLPRFLPDQHYAPAIIFQLADARKAGISQTQVDAFIRADMVRNGWLRA